MPEIWHDTKTYNFKSGADNCASKICKLFQCACTDLCSVKWRNGNSFYFFQKVKVLDVDTLDSYLAETNRLFKDLIKLY